MGGERVSLRIPEYFHVIIAPFLATTTHLHPYFCQEEHAANQMQFRWGAADENWSENRLSSHQELCEFSKCCFQFFSSMLQETGGEMYEWNRNPLMDVTFIFKDIILKISI